MDFISMTLTQRPRNTRIITVNLFFIKISICVNPCIPCHPCEGQTGQYKYNVKDYIPDTNINNSVSGSDLYPEQFAESDTKDSYLSGL